MNRGLFGLPVGFAGARVRASATQSIPNSTDTILTGWTVEDFDTADFHNVTTNPSRLTVPAPGWYLIGCTVDWDTNASGVRLADLLKNGVSRIAGQLAFQADSNGNLNGVSVLALLNAGDYVEVIVNQNSGGARTTAINTERMSFWIWRVG